MKRPSPRLTVSALRGGSGKTTICLGLLSAWRRRGLRIIPFKKGPDYIDAGWLAQAADEPCYNLDTFLMGPKQTSISFQFRIGRPDLHGALIEGNRGLFDGVDETGASSTAELAKLLSSPLVLIVDCTKITRTLAALVKGCQVFDPELKLSGVILNEVATSRQEALVRVTIESETGLPVLGSMPRLRSHDLPERHLGLIPHQEHPAVVKTLDILAELAEKHLDLDRLWNIASSASWLESPPISPWLEQFKPFARPVRIGVIRDSVFQFYYPENLEALERCGAKLKVFSALEVGSLPPVDALYLGGGFPETHAEPLANNEGLRRSIKEAAAKGLPIYAECGGLMYLGEALVLGERTFPMVGTFPVTFGLEKRPQGHGYTLAAVVKPNPFFPVGTRLFGHEFHYSRPLAFDPAKVNLVFDMERGHGFDQGLDGLSVNNVLASYTHMHALTNILWAESLVKLAADFKED